MPYSERELEIVQAWIRQQGPEFRGGNKALQSTTDRECLLEGPAGTGKSRADLFKLWTCATRFPGMRGLLVRKTRASLTDSVLVELETYIIPPGHPCMDGAYRGNRTHYSLPNGSEIVLAGLDKATRILSSQYDMIVVPEATEITEDDWEMLLTRNRSPVMPYRQMIADCNPDAPSHWLNQRANDGRMVRLLTRHHDNPAYHDGADWTEIGREYVLGTLGRLTGLRRRRYLDGIWAAAEGTIYDMWDPARGLVPRFDPPQEWRRIWSVDFGYTNPFVWQSWAIDPDGRMFLHREIYHSRRLVEDLAKEIRNASAGDPRPEVIVCDHDAEDRATLERHIGMRTTTACKAVSAGIQAVAARITPAGDGRGRLFIMEGALQHEVDSELKNRRVPTCTAQEIEAYVWDVRDGRTKGDIPVKEDDHGVDAMRYAVAYVDQIDRVQTSSTSRPRPKSRTYQAI